MNQSLMKKWYKCEVHKKIDWCIGVICSFCDKDKKSNYEVF